MDLALLNALHRKLSECQGNLLWDGLDQDGRNAMIELIARENHDKHVVVLCENDRRVNQLTVMLRQVLDISVLAIYQRSHLPVEVLAKEENDGDRVSALYLLANNEPCVIVALSLIHI